MSVFAFIVFFVYFSTVSHRIIVFVVLAASMSLSECSFTGLDCRDVLLVGGLQSVLLTFGLLLDNRST